MSSKSIDFPGDGKMIPDGVGQEALMCVMKEAYKDGRGLPMACKVQ